jgi:hypothetical protein
LDESGYRIIVYREKRGSPPRYISFRDEKKVTIEVLCIGGKRGSLPRYISFRDEKKVVIET